MTQLRDGQLPSLLESDRDAHIGILVSHLRIEEKQMLQSARDRGIHVDLLFDRKLTLEISAGKAGASDLQYDVIIDRSVAHSRALYTLRTLESWGIPTLNRSSTTSICDDKALCTLALAEASIDTPRTIMAFSVESALEACETIGYPAVLKPTTGSWGRLLTRVNGPEQAKVILQQKAELGSFHHSVFYVQEYLEKPGRDIRVFVVGDKVLAASYRSSEHWITNTARGATSRACPITPHIEELSIEACKAVGARLAGVDLIETFDGYSVIEVNTGGEFHGLQETTETSIAGAIIREALDIAHSAAEDRHRRAEQHS